ncbi:MAG: hypothetical protein V3V49_10765 [Candidatus Krumholzibacteria bacterium]
MKLLIPLLAVGLLLITGCYEEGPLQADMSDPALEPISPVSPVMVPFRGVYDETFVLVPPFPPPIVNVELNGEGFATYLGKSTFFGVLQADMGVTTGTIVFSAANGDELEIAAVGFTTPPDATGAQTFSGDWDVTGGSGRFKNATGSGMYDGSGNAFTGEGHIIFDGAISQPTGRKPQVQH